ncbi:hypothetical protein ES703_17920 [subsurface metagenome]
MPVKETTPPGALTEELFRLEPAWSKQAFAYRLLCMLAPPAITRRLQRLLKGAYIFSGLGIPPDLVLPPGVILPPGTVFPPGWKFGDPLPRGILSPGVDWDDPETVSVVGPEHLVPWAPGPLGGYRGPGRSGKFSQFYEPWNSLDMSVWTFGVGTIPAWSVVSGWLVSDYSGMVSPDNLYHDIAGALPVNLNLQVLVRTDSGTANFVLKVYTGSVLIQITFAGSVDTNSVYHIDGSTIGTNNKHGDNNTWLLHIRSGFWKLYRNGILAAQNFSYTSSDLYPGRVDFKTNSNCYAKVDYFILQKA